MIHVFCMCDTGTSTRNYGNPSGVAFGIPGNTDVTAQHPEDVDLGDDVDRAARSESVDVRYLSNLCLVQNPLISSIV